MSRVRLTNPARVLLVALVVLTPVGLGGVLDWVAPLALAVALNALTLALVHRHDARIPPIALLPLAMLALCLFQLIPLPPALLHLLSPDAESLREFALVPLGFDRWRPISLDTGATWAEVVKALLYFITIVAAYHAASTRTGTPWLIGAVAAVGPAFVAIGLLHALFGVEALFGLYTFKEAHPALLTPFGNPNHLAGLLILSGSACTGLVVESTERSRRVAWALAWFACCGGVLISGSRAGIGVFVLTQLALLGWVAFTMRRRDAGKVRGRVLTLGATVLAALTVGAFALGERLYARFTDTATLRLKVLEWPHALELAKDYWRFGVGRGGFVLAFSKYYAEHSGKTFTHPENIVLQWVGELGIPLGLLMLAFGAWLLGRLIWSRRGSLLELSPLVGVAAVAVHNLADFSLEYPGVTVPLCVVLGVAAAADEREPYRLNRVWVLVPAVLVGGLAVFLTGESFRAAETQLRQLYAGARQASQVTVPAKRRIEKHPADYLLYTYAAAAEVGLKGGDPQNALAYANRALALNPNDPSAHYAAARALVALEHRSQALVEYHLALEVTPGRGELVTEADAYAQSLDEVRALGGDDPLLLAELARATPLKGDATALLMSEAAAKNGAPAELTLEAVNLWVALGKVEIASEQLDGAFSREPPSPDLFLARSRLEQARHDTAAAARALDDGLTKWPGQFDLTLERVRMELADHRHGPATKLLQQASAVAVRPDQRLELTLVEAQVDLEMGRLNRAIELYQGAVLRFPSTRTHQTLASAYLKAGRYDDAISELHAAEHYEGKAGQQALDDYIHTLEAQRDAKRAAAKQ